MSFYSQEGSIDEITNKSNLYDTKDYYDYYTRLQPKLRNPKLPKPTYLNNVSLNSSQNISLSDISPSKEEKKESIQEK